MDIGLRTFLIATAIAFPVIALIAFVIILFKIKQKRKEINASQQLIQKELLEKPSEQKMINRADFGKSDVNLQKLLKNSISHEIVEFCINTCIRNEYKNILMISNVDISFAFWKIEFVNVLPIFCIIYPSKYNYFIYAISLFYKYIKQL